MLVNHIWWFLGYVWDLTSMFVVPKGMQYSLLYYHSGLDDELGVVSPILH